MSTYWDTWWSEKKARLKVSDEFVQTCKSRGIDQDVWTELTCGLMTEYDWPVLKSLYPNLEKFEWRMPTPAFTWVLDGEFGWEGILIRSSKEKTIASARQKNSPGHRPLCLGFAKALPHIWEKGYVIVVEGVFDYLGVRKHTPNVIAVLTDATSSLMAAMLARYTSVVGLMLDNDAPGKDGAKRSQERLEKEKLQVFPIHYSAKDPGQLLENGRHAEMEKTIKESISEMEFMVSMLRA